MTITETHTLAVERARQHNLKNISLQIPHDAVTVVTGVSGSGKSSLAFDTLFAEGQWRYVESLSTYARMFIQKLDRPDVDRLVNIRPAIAIEQKNPVRTARSTVGTATEVTDLLRLLFAKIGHPACPACRVEARRFDPGTVADDVLTRFPNGRAMILFPAVTRPGHERDLAASLLSRGFIRVRRGEEVIDLQPGAARSLHGGGPVEVIVDRLVLRPDARPRVVEAVELAFREGEGACRIAVFGPGPGPGKLTRTYTTGLRCPGCARTFETPSPLLFSFNHPVGACPECRGFGNILCYDEDLIVPDRTRSLSQGAIEPWTKPGTEWWQRQLLLALRRRGVSLTTPYGELPAAVRRLIWRGGDTFEGLDQFFESLERKRYKLHVRVFLSRYRSPRPCPACAGARLQPAALQVTVAGRTIHQVSELTIREAAAWAERLALSDFEAATARDILDRLRAKLGFLLRVGLGYLTLARQTRTLSGGESQRIALANQLGAKLVGTLYVLDEPTIGLHARDTATLVEIMRDLAGAGNTVVVVEHDRQVIETADYLVELGPAAGEHGGQVVFAGAPDRFLAQSPSLTARYLRGEETIPVPRARRPGSGRAITIAGAHAHNLRHLTVRVPLQMLVCVTGVSGSGKSTLVRDTLYHEAARALGSASRAPSASAAVSGLEHVRAVQLIDQEPIGRTPRSNPVTYLKAFDEIRALYASVPDARRRGLTRAHFSFNTSKGRCPRCQGSGVERLEMYFFEDVYVTCEACEGRRFLPEVLNVRYRGKTIAEALRMTVEEAQTFFSAEPRLGAKLHLLRSIGLGYVRLGQPATSLSGGEAQRLKIAAELLRGSARTSARRDGRGILYILDEPTTGLHFEDLKKLLAVLNRLVDAGHTVIVVEHHLDFIKTADWIIDLGPEGGEEGGRLVAEGRPEEITKVDSSHTGRYLKRYLARERYWLNR